MLRDLCHREEGGSTDFYSGIIDFFYDLSYYDEIQFLDNNFVTFCFFEYCKSKRLHELFETFLSLDLVQLFLVSGILMFKKV